MSKFQDFVKWVNGLGNTILEGATAGYWQGKDNYTGLGANPTPTENNLQEQAKETLENQDVKAPTIPTTGEAPKNEEIKDKTNENIEIPMYYGENDVFNWIEAQQRAQWEREDAIRKEVQAREDTAIQRQVEDAIRAGVNPNLIDITGAESGGGITSATGKDYTVYEKEMEQYLKELEMLFDKNFQGSENDKDRTIDIIKGLMTIIGIKSASSIKTK